MIIWSWPLQNIQGKYSFADWLWHKRINCWFQEACNLSSTPVTLILWHYYESHHNVTTSSEGSRLWNDYRLNQTRRENHFCQADKLPFWTINSSIHSPSFSWVMYPLLLPSLPYDKDTWIWIITANRCFLDSEHVQFLICEKDINSCLTIFFKEFNEIMYIYILKSILLGKSYVNIFLKRETKLKYQWPLI